MTIAYEQREIRLVLAGRDLPLWADADRWPPLPGDQAALQEFLQRLARRTAAPPTPFSADIVRERAMHLIEALPISQVAFIPPDERDRLIAALAPVEQLLAALRGAAGHIPP
ncbi:MAG: hypothetical protein RMJ48_04570 [Roseiflexaceae bacterium]|nr:hypothetical protein [Roseiflexaceae bacterium]